MRDAKTKPHLSPLESRTLTTGDVWPDYRPGLEPDDMQSVEVGPIRDLLNDVPLSVPILFQVSPEFPPFPEPLK